MSKQETTGKPVCVRCGAEVRLTTNGPARHTGHVDPAKDRTCGWWGYRIETRETYLDAE